jgi:hypothetical protein
MAYGVGSGAQVGFANVGTTHHASLWSGSAASWVSLNPAGATYADAFGAKDGKQVGAVNIGGLPHASLWYGTAASWVDLHPGMPYFRSGLRGIDGNYQVGGAVDTGNNPHAGLWSGSAASFVDLTPTNATGSEAVGISGGYQVGNAVFNGARRAGIWNGTAASWVDLHFFLPPEFTSSVAMGVTSYQGNLLVAGYGFNASTGRDEALLWIRSDSQTVLFTTATLGPGVAVGGTSGNLNAGDDVYYSLRPGVTLTTFQDPIGLVLSFNLPSPIASSMSTVIESRAQQGTIRQTVEAYNFSSPGYLQIDQRTLATTDTSITTLISPPGSHIGPGNEVRIRVSYRATGPVLIYPWVIHLDEATLRITP